MKKLFSIILPLFMFSSAVFSQTPDPDVEKMNYTRKMMYGDALMSAGSYYNAQDIYKMAFDDDATQEAAFKLARAYYLARNYKDAEIWYKKSMELGKSKDEYPESGFYYAMSLKYNAKYTEAKEAFKAFQKNGKVKGAMATTLKRQSKNEDKGCDLAILLAQSPATVNVEHLGTNVNNNYTDFSPKFDPDNNLVYASLVSEDVINLDAQKKTDMKARIFSSTTDGDSWGKGKEISAPFNKGSAHTGNGAYSADGKRFYYTECSPNDSLVMICKIFVSEYKNGDWGNPKEVSQVNAANATATTPAVGEYKGKEILYFSSNRPGGRGGMDIWFAEIQGKGSGYGNPQNCGTKINTAGDEVTPFYNETLGTLYFSSNGQINIGGQDIFSAKGGMKTFESPSNIGMPFNSSVDDVYFSTDPSGRKGFFVSNRKGGFNVKSETCCDDIYAFKYPPEFMIMARTINSKTNEQIGEASIDLNRAGAKMNFGVSKPAAYNDFFVGTAVDKFSLTGSKEGFYQGESTISTGGKDNDTFYVDIMMEPIPIIIPIEVKNIYYELAKADLRPESKDALDSLYTIMKNNPQIIVEFGSHTDSRDTYEKNIDLSQRRAQAVVDFLTAKGIDTTRMKPKGYGESVPKTLSSDVILPSGKVVPKGTVLEEAFINKYQNNNADYEFLHQINRRTEFKILGEIPGAIVKYDEAAIEAEKARLREENEKRNKQLQDLQQVDESDVIDNTDTKTDTKTNTKTDTKTDTKTTTTTATLDATLTKKGNMYEGNAMVNGKEATKYILNLSPSVTVTMVNKDFFIKLWNAGLVTDADIKNDKPTDLGNGTTIKGDVFVLKSIQCGDITLTNVDVKLSMTSTQSLIVPVKAVEKNGCSFDTKNVKLKCK